MTQTFAHPACPHCAARAGIYLADCRGCAARSVARSPQHFEAKRAGKLTAAYRGLLERYGVTHDEVKAAQQRERVA